ncbi:carbohydrate ABC transporter permease [Nocardioides bruguierae]|uniref:carbohydrate ABC transporter permease n=1 Tax=Nocardioides bruguierae TaxID=2945102 RepID=UPI002020E11B|nr:carbohydrate ABC transporter permease [Nocardioides bruguierae]MCL8025308.1 carbohydrate ABC transporter permease [Nocardioides bruguierae]
MRRGPNWLAFVLALLWLAIILVPVYIMLRAAFMSRDDFAADGPVGLPASPTLENFRYALDNGFGLFLVNSLIMTIGCVLIVVLLVPPLAFAIVRGRSRWTRLSFQTMLFGLAIPAQVVVIPLNYLISQLGLYDTRIGVILPTAAFTIPLTTLIMTGVMREIGQDMYEAMSLDGAGAVRVFLQLALPLSKGGVATIAIFTALQAWNNYLIPLTLTRSADLRVATLGLGIFRKEFALNVPGLMSAIVLTVIPILLFYIFARRALIAGIMGTGGK